MPPDRTTHGMYGTTEYKIWSMMLQRCNNPKATGFKHWGGRGIRVCRRWYRFENFYEDMGNRPDNKTLDRIENDGDYEPDNCKWSTGKQQAKNRRRKKITPELVVELHSLLGAGIPKTKIALMLHISRSAVYAVLNNEY